MQLRFVAVLAAAAAITVTSTIAPDGADEFGISCATPDHRTGKCVVYSKPDWPEGGGGGGGGGGTVECVDRMGVDEDERVVTCVHGRPDPQHDYFWSNYHQCYTRLGYWTAIPGDQPRPRGQHPWPEGEEDGYISECTREMLPGDDPISPNFDVIWSFAPPWRMDDPEELVRVRIEQINFQAGEIGIVPHDEPGSIGIIGLPTYMWVADVNEETWGPHYLNFGSGDLGLTAIAEVERVEWDMGDGTVVECTTPGTEYQDHFWDNPSPDCGHTYTVQGHYPVTATFYWVVDWSTDTGQSGTIEFELINETQIAMGELQVIIEY